MSNALRIVAVNNTQRLYDNTTDILTGFAVNITIEDVAGVGECELPQVVIDVKKNGSYDVVGVDKVRVNVVPKLEDLEVTQNGEYLPPTDIAGFSKVSVDVQPVLEELTITQNGEYIPQEGVDGFSKVVARVVPTGRVVLPNTNLRVNNDAIINGYWAGELVDVSKMTNINAMFYNCSQLQQLDVSNWDVSNVTTMIQTFDSCSQLQQLDVSRWDVRSLTNLQGAFSYCSQLQQLDVSSWDVKNLVNIGNLFQGCFAIKLLDLRNWDMSSLTSLGYVFYQCTSLESLIGGKTIDDVLTNNISCFNGLKVSNAYMFYRANNIDRASLRALINGLADLTGQPAQTLNLSVQGTTLLSKLTEEDIAIATAKNWTII
jgi:surface protein